ncbi:MAG: hypothetical protein MRZ67_04950, partial [Christensenella sp.]|nr:hypothetical protein [Christensenella sp.]
SSSSLLHYIVFKVLSYCLTRPVSRAARDSLFILSDYSYYVNPFFENSDEKSSVCILAPFRV